MNKNRTFALHLAASLTGLTLTSMLNTANAQTDTGPSFDCTRATLPDEIVICSDPQLSKLDRIAGEGFNFITQEMGTDFSQSLAKPLLKKRNQCAYDKNCIEKAIITQIEIFAAAGAPISTPNSISKTDELTSNTSEEEEQNPTSSEDQAEYDGVKIVNAEGIGSTANEAVQNAAQNALMEVVGAYIDASTTLEQRTAIEGNMREETTQINVDVTQYSQGVIEFVKVLETNEDAAGYRASVTVGIRNQQLKTRIKEITGGSAAIGASMFAQVKTATDNTNAAADILFNEILLPALNWEGAVIDIGDPQLQTGDWYDFKLKMISEAQAGYQKDLYTDSTLSALANFCHFDEMNFISIPVKFEIPDSLLTSTREKLQEISSDSSSSSVICPNGRSCVNILGDPTVYIVSGQNELQSIMENHHFPVTELQILGSDNSIIWSDRTNGRDNCADGTSSTPIDNQIGWFIVGTSKNGMHRARTEDTSFYAQQNFDFTIFPMLEGYLFARLSDQVLRKARTLIIKRVLN